jgi:hypothetical protein
VALRPRLLRGVPWSVGSARVPVAYGPVPESSSEARLRSRRGLGLGPRGPIGCDSVDPWCSIMGHGCTHAHGSAAELPGAVVAQLALPAAHENEALNPAGV